MISSGARLPGTCAVVITTSAVFACSAINARPRIHRFFRQLDCVTTCVFSFDSAEIDFEKCRAERFHLFACGGAHVVTFDDSAETSRSGNRL